MFWNNWVPKFLRSDAPNLLELDFEGFNLDQVKNNTVEHLVNHVSKLKQKHKIIIQFIEIDLEDINQKQLWEIEMDPCHLNFKKIDKQRIEQIINIQKQLELIKLKYEQFWNQSERINQVLWSCSRNQKRDESNINMVLSDLKFESLKIDYVEFRKLIRQNFYKLTNQIDAKLIKIRQLRKLIELSGNCEKQKKLENKKKDPPTTKNNPTIKKNKEQKNLDIDQNINETKKENILQQIQIQNQITYDSDIEKLRKTMKKKQVK